VSAARTLAAALVIAALTGVAACGGDDKPTSGGSQASGGGGGSANAGYAKQQIDKYKQEPQFAAPGDAFDAAAKMKGKTLWSIPASSAVPFVANIQNYEQDIAKQVGVGFERWANQGQPAQWVQGMQSAINRNASAIDLLAGINPAAVAQQVKQAEKQHIPVVVSHLLDPKQASPVKTTARVDIPYEQAGRLLADWAIWKTDAKANALVVTIKEVSSTEAMTAGIKDEFAKHCPGCKLQSTNVTIAEAAQKIQPQTQAALVRDPNINYVLALYDSVEVPGVVAAIRAANAAKRVKVATFNGTPAIFKMIQDDDIVEMDVGEDINWIAHAVMDQNMRVAAGLDPVGDPRIGIRVFDDSNVADTGSPPQDAMGYGNSYVDGYAKLWQMG